jgi:HEAT repeat protein
MPERRPASRRVAGILVGAVLITAIGLGVKFGFYGAPRPNSDPTGSGGAAAINDKSPLALLNEGVRTGDPHALTFVFQRVAQAPAGPGQALGEQEAATLIDTLSSLRAGFPRQGAPGRATTITIACRILDRFAVEPAPSQWALALKPVHDLMTASLADTEQMPRYQALVEFSRLWVWMPGRSLSPFEEQTLGDWKAAIHMPVVRCLGATDPATRMAAIACLGSLPIDSAAAAAVAYVDDPTSADVRKQTLSSFSQRSALLTDEMLFKRMHDSDAGNREMASLILKTRGLSREQIGLGGLIYSPRPEQRVSVIPLLKNRTDVDPVIWLIQLSRDPVETVRMTSIEALAKHKSPSVQRRLAEMARTDNSEAVRQAAGKIVSAAGETTAALPPLPGSSSLNPRAN